MASAWKVAYADFMTAMMAFFLLMWILAMAPKETLVGLAGYFKADAAYVTDVSSPLSNANNDMIQATKAANLPSFTESEKSNMAIIQALHKLIMKDAKDMAASGISSDNAGVLLHMTPDLMFKPGTVEFTPEAERIMDGVVDILNKHKAYLVIRGYTDASETGAPLFASKWELASARANAAVKYLESKGVEAKRMRTVSYADTRPKVPSTVADAVQQNGRVEFNFHRPEVLTNAVGY